MSHALERRLEEALEGFVRDGVYKRLNYLDSPQAARVTMEGRGEVIILSSNNYLGLSNQPEVVAAGKAALDRYGAGTASVRFICGTFTIHRALEHACARLVGTPASLSFVSCWNANEAFPGTLLTENDVIISDQLNHASIIDGIRLAKAITRCRSAVYRHGDLADLDAKLEAERGDRVPRSTETALESASSVRSRSIERFPPASEPSLARDSRPGLVSRSSSGRRRRRSRTCRAGRTDRPRAGRRRR